MRFLVSSVLCNVNGCFDVVYVYLLISTAYFSCLLSMYSYYFCFVFHWMPIFRHGRCKSCRSCDVSVLDIPVIEKLCSAWEGGREGRVAVSVVVRWLAWVVTCAGRVSCWVLVAWVSLLSMVVLRTCVFVQVSLYMHGWMDERTVHCQVFDWSFSPAGIVAMWHCVDNLDWWDLTFVVPFPSVCYLLLSLAQLWFTLAVSQGHLYCAWPSTL